MDKATLAALVEVAERVALSRRDEAARRHAKITLIRRDITKPGKEKIA